MFRVIDGDVIYDKLVDVITKANFELSRDVEDALWEAYNNEDNENAKIVLDILIKNARIAKEKRIPICQDCGMVVAFVEIGDKVYVKGNLNDLIDRAVSDVYKKNYLRPSVVKDPLRRINTQDNTPAIVHYEIKPGDKLRVYILIKGFGSENASIVKSLLPTVTEEELINEIVNHVKNYGPNACPPLLVGIGIGGTLEKAALLSKKATLRPLKEKNHDPYWAKMEEILLEEINKLNIGPGGLGGKTTALGVHIEVFPVHIAGFTLAINMQCSAIRHGWFEL